jgi:methionyl-tRNA formyltransferase
VAQIAALRPDVGVIVAYGEILRQPVLNIPPLGFLNIHPSLLPLYRGPAPVAGAILAGERETGVTIMRLDQQMDSGPILAQVTVPLLPTARTGPLTDELMRLGGRLMCEVLPRYAAGELAPTPQEHSQATFTKLLRKTDGAVDWAQPALVIERMIRAYDPWPGAYTLWRGQQLKLLEAAIHADWNGAAAPGTIIGAEPEPLVATGSGALALRSVQPAGKRPMQGSAWLRGQPDAVGQPFGE